MVGIALKRVRAMAWLLLCAAATAGCQHRLRHLFTDPPTYPACPSAAAAIDVPMFHGDRARSGWNANESDLTPDSVKAGFGWLWDSDPLDASPRPPRIHATPLYFDSVGPQPFVVTATSNSWVYAIAACSGAARAGTFLWKTRLTTPVQIPDLDGGLPLGVLSTPIADLAARPPRLYVTAADERGWSVFALDLRNGAVLPGWPLALPPAIVVTVNKNGGAFFGGPTLMSQRGALALSPAGDVLYVPFATFSDKGPGWMVAVDTRAVAIAASFSSSRSTAHTANGGMWGSGGPAVDGSGRLFDTAGNAVTGPIAGTWGESLLSWGPALDLAGTYTPFNHCQLDDADIDVGGSAPVLLPDLDPAATSTPHLAAFGSKQGNVYLVDRDRLPGRLDARPPCSTDSSADGSLLAPGPQPQFAARGPLNVFGPYTEKFGNADYAKMRTSLVAFVTAGGTFLFASGSSKAAADSTASVPPAVARLRVVTAPGQPAWLTLDAVERTLTFANPGPPVVTSNGSATPIVWVLDSNASRSAATLDHIRSPILYAVDGATLQPLWQSLPDRVGIGGKYASPTVAHGWVFVATDRLQAFGLRR
jgi:hypothetical protein